MARMVMDAPGALPAELIATMEAHGIIADAADKAALEYWPVHSNEIAHKGAWQHCRDLEGMIERLQEIAVRQASEIKRLTDALDDANCIHEGQF